MNLIKTAAALVLSGTLAMSGCISDQEREAAYRVITALPEEIKGCVFIGDVDSYGAAIVDAARFSLRLKTARLGGTHLVEKYAYPVTITRNMLGVALSGRAYRCPEGLGPLTESDSARITYEIPSADSVFLWP